MSYLQSPGRTAKSDTIAARREFLARCGKFAVVTPPAITLLLSTSLNSSAIAHSSGRRNGNSAFDPDGHGDRQFDFSSHDNNSNSSNNGGGNGNGGSGDGDRGGSRGHGHLYSDAGSGGHGGHDNSGLGEDDEGKRRRDR